MLAIAEPRAKSKAECFDRPYGTDLPFTSFPSTSYWATFTESLRNKSPHHTILALKLTRMGGCRIAAWCMAFLERYQGRLTDPAFAGSVSPYHRAHSHSRPRPASLSRSKQAILRAC